MDTFYNSIKDRTVQLMNELRSYLWKDQSSQHTHTNHGYRADIDGLRALAVLAVVAYHAFPTSLSGGFVGVDIFFVISGYLISTILYRELDSNSFSYLSFIARRMRRIAPALIVILVSVFFLGWHLLLRDEYLDLGKQVVAGAGFVSNIFYWKQSGYFDSVSESKPLLHLWSLGIEEQFYLLWPTILYLIHKLRINKVTAAFVLIVSSFFLEIWAMNVRPVAAFYLLPTRLWELMAGALLAKLDLRYRENIFYYLRLIFFESITHAKIKNKIISHLFSLFGVFLMSVAIVITEKATFPGSWPWLPVLGAMFYIFAGNDGFLNRWLFSLRPVVFIGLISYPLYLWHWPLLSFGFIVESGTPVRNIRIGIVLVSIVLSVATYYVVEKPIQRIYKNLDSFKRKLQLLSYTSVGLILCGVFGILCVNKTGFIERRAAKLYSDDIAAQLEGALWKYTKNDFCLNRYPFPQAKDYGWWFCMQSRDEAPTILLLGNSYANQLYPGLVKHPAFSNHVVLSIGTCGWEQMGGDIMSGNLKLDFSPCSGNRAIENANFINALIEREKTIQYVILAGSGSDGSDRDISVKDARISYLKKLGKKVIIFADHPVAEGVNPRVCYKRRFSSVKDADCIFSYSSSTKLQFKNKLLAKYPDIVFFDPAKAFRCDSILKKCDFEQNGMPMFRDEYSHLSEYGSSLVIDYFFKEIGDLNKGL